MSIQPPAHAVGLRKDKTQLVLSIWAGIAAPWVVGVVVFSIFGGYFWIAAIVQPAQFWGAIVAALWAFSGLLTWLLHGNWRIYGIFIALQTVFWVVGGFVVDILVHLLRAQFATEYAGLALILMLSYPLGWFAGVYLNNRLTRRTS